LSKNECPCPPAATPMASTATFDVASAASSVTGGTGSTTFPHASASGASRMAERANVGIGIGGGSPGLRPGRRREAPAVR
jgi:hypothetical protein